MTDRYDLGRFVSAQGPVYEHAVEELRRGQKRSHWMWFVFPQFSGLGQSTMSRAYAICSLEEARAYLAHPILGPRLLDCAAILAAREDATAVEILGPVDAQKLRSSMTLFMRAAPEQSVFAQVLERYFAGSPDGATDKLLPGDLKPGAG